MTQFLKDKKSIQSWLDAHFIKNYTIDETDLSVSVKGSVFLESQNLTHIPVQFKTVSDWFKCGRNQLTSLLGSPSTVGYDFYCDHNALTDLSHAPKTVGGDFFCIYNQLTSLFGVPQHIEGNFQGFCNHLKVIDYWPNSVKGGVYLFDNPQLQLPPNQKPFFYFEEIQQLHLETVALREKEKLHHHIAHITSVSEGPASTFKV